MKCYATTKKGTLCKKKAAEGLQVCHTHADICTICHVTTGVWQTLKCGHQYHVQCLQQWVCSQQRRRMLPTCPLCRQSLLVYPSSNALLLASSIPLPSDSAEYRSRRAVHPRLCLFLCLYAVVMGLAWVVTRWLEYVGPDSGSRHL